MWLDTGVNIIELGCMGCCFLISVLAYIILYIGRRLDRQGIKKLLYIAAGGINFNVVLILYTLFHSLEGTMNHYFSCFLIFLTFILLYLMGAELLFYLAYKLEKQGRVVKWKNRLNVLLIFYIIPYIINLFYPIIFRLDEKNHYVAIIPNYFGTLWGMSLIGFILVVLFYYHTEFSKSTIVSICFFCLGPVVSAILYIYKWEYDFMFLFVTASVFILSLSAECNYMLEYAKRQNEKKVIRDELLITQLRPHFIYNALSSISQLCKYDSLQASHMTDRFAEFLNKNMKDVQHSRPIPFREELEYIKNYVAIEKMRFGEDLEVIYKIGTKDFFIPPFIMQPLIENSIKHGLGGREEGGMIMISTQPFKGGTRLTITDDGVGFDQKEKDIFAASQEGGRVHIGMKSVYERIRAIPRGEIMVKSNPGKGTMVMVVIPDTYGRE